jgi:hypothetical protein
MQAVVVQKMIQRELRRARTGFAFSASDGSAVTLRLPS